VPGYEFSGRIGILAPSGTPEASIATLARELEEAVGERQIRERFAVAGAEARMRSAAQFRSDLAAEASRWDALMRRDLAKTPQ
jgi:tripartite-type tricarboxylate transporter receptor subunit TctC